MKSLHLRSLTRPFARARVRYSAIARRWVMRRKPAAVKCASAQVILQLDMFGFVEITQASIYKATSRFQRKSRRKPKRNRKIRGHQYKIPIKLRDKPRKIEFQTRDKSHLDHLWKDEDATRWSDSGAATLHRALLQDSIKSIRSAVIAQTNVHAEIWMWINRTGTSEPFSFEKCCELDNCDPDVLRAMLKRLVSCDMPHIDLLRESIVAAEAGNPDALQWCLSEVEGSLSFKDCIRATGFDIKDLDALRSEIRAPEMQLAKVLSHVA